MVGWWYKPTQTRVPKIMPNQEVRMEVEEVPGAGGSGEGRGGDIPRGEYPPELLASQRTMEELGLPEALLAPLEDEVETSGPTTLLQAAILSEGRTGANLFVQGRSGAETTVAFSLLLLKQLLDQGVVSADDMQPWEGCRESGEEKRKADGTGFWAGLKKSADSGAAGDKESIRPALQALVLARNKEIATSVTDTITRLGQCIPAFEVACLVGGIPVAEHVRALGRGCHIAVGTPGRVRYLISKGALQPSTARTLILESADCLMAPVFQEDVGWIAGRFPESKQVLAFSTVDASTVKPALCALVGVAELRGLGLVGGAAHADGVGGSSSEITASGGEQEDGDGVVRWPSPIPMDRAPSAEAVARATVVSATASAFLMGRGRSAGSVGFGSSHGVQDRGIEVSVDEQSDSSTSTSDHQAQPQSPTSQAQAVAAAKATAAEIVKKDRNYLRVTTAASVTSSASTATATPSPPSLRTRAQRGARSSQTALGTHTPALAPGSPPPPPGSSHSSSANGDSAVAPAAPSSSAGGSGDLPPPPCSPPPHVHGDGYPKLSSGQSSPLSDSRRVFTSVAHIGESSSSVVPSGDEAAAQRSWPQASSRSACGSSGTGNIGERRRDGGGSGTGTDAISPTSSRLGRDHEDRTSLGLLSPGAFKKDLEGAEGAGAVALRSADVTPPVRARATAEAATTAEIVVYEEDAARYLEEQQHKQLDLTSAAVTLMEEWEIPPVLLAALEADGFVVPTAMQASVWTAGRGMYRADLLVHGRPGEETATAYAVVILERVWQRYPPPAEPRQETRSDVDVQLERATNPPPALELQALVLTRTRDMAASVTEELLRLGRGIHGLVIATLIGGVPVAEQSKALAGGCHVAVGTPGRVRFLMKKGLLRPHSAKTLVLDSADWLMAAVFQEDVGWIASRFPMDKQVLAFSGADPSAVEEGLKELVNSPHMTSIGGSSAAIAANPAAQSTQVVPGSLKNIDSNDAISSWEGTDSDAAAAAAAAAAVACAERELLAAEEELRAALAQTGGFASGSIAGDPGAADTGKADGRVGVEGQAPTARRSYRPVQDLKRQGGELAVIRNSGFGAVTLTASGKAAAGVAGFCSGGVPPPANGAMGSAAAQRARGGVSAAPRRVSDHRGVAMNSASGAARNNPSSYARSIQKAGGGGASFLTRVRLSRENQLYGAWCRQAIGGVGGGGRR